jgi:hypothetical protein
VRLAGMHANSPSQEGPWNVILPTDTAHSCHTIGSHTAVSYQNHKSAHNLNFLKRCPADHRFAVTAHIHLIQELQSHATVTRVHHNHSRKFLASFLSFNKGMVSRRRKCMESSHLGRRSSENGTTLRLILIGGPLFRFQRR